MNSAVVLLSGGLDSTTLAYKLYSDGFDLQALFVDYGQRHVKEEEYSRRTARALQIPWSKVDMTSITKLLATSGSSLVAPTTSVPHGHYAADNMASTVVPNRNMMMLSIAAAVAIANRAQFVATAVHAGDHAIYPDCRPEFIQSLQQTVRIGMAGYGGENLEVIAPFVHISKDDIAGLAYRLGINPAWTWSCYEGKDKQCGRCGTCVERIEALTAAGFELKDSDYETGGLEYARNLLAS